MSLQKKILVTACAANGLATYGTVPMLLQRLIKGSATKVNTKTAKQTGKKTGPIAKKTKKTKPNIKKTKKAKPNANNMVVVTPKKTTPFKTSGSSKRLSASYYFNQVCQSKIGRCCPQMIQEPDGRCRLKEIKIVSGKTGAHPRWVLVK